jgi:demethylmenaquinone methyltransferase / 2-methoxy-6-polyprenyl-1,4-benzoquinol methylase
MSKVVHDMFASIAGTYDRGNDVLSLGIHRFWRKASLSFAGIHGKHPSRVLDLCCGTGDFCLALYKKVHRESLIIGLDFVFPMLELAKPKCRKEMLALRDQNVNSSSPFYLMQGDALSIPFRDLSFDACTIGFGIRNVDDPLLCLKGMRRVLKEGGKAIVLEFGTPESHFVRPFFTFYSKYIMPKLGALISGNKVAYEYLPETSLKFPCGKEFCSLMEQAGLKEVRYKAFMGGIAYVYTGTRK